jgi:hypothetical protein
MVTESIWSAKILQEIGPFRCDALAWEDFRRILVSENSRFRPKSHKVSLFFRVLDGFLHALAK